MNSNLPEGYLSVLNNNYVGIVDHMGSDLSVTSAARVSFDKVASEWNEKEAKLLAFLWREGHTSPFRHASLTFEIYAPLFVARQWWKHVVSCSHVDDQLAHNESSRRYITEEPTFYVPTPAEWRSSPESKKQGSGAPLPHFREQQDYMVTMGMYKGWGWNGPANAKPKDYGNYWTEELVKTIDAGVAQYEAAMAAGIAPEQARLFLPAYGMNVRWRWTASLGAVMHFLHQRLEHDAQFEIMLFARAVKELTATAFPVCMEVIS